MDLHRRLHRQSAISIYTCPPATGNLQYCTNLLNGCCRFAGYKAAMQGEAIAAITVDVSVECDDWLALCANAETLVETAARTALTGGAGPSLAPLVVGVVLTDDERQRRLNLTYRGSDEPANVLAFALRDAATPAPAGAPVLLGDVTLAFGVVAREAAQQRKNLADHLQHLVVHGVLHLVGFDHQGRAEAALMEARETEILASLGVPDPYRDTM
jgi:probable rRNA maturation factor